MKSDTVNTLRKKYPPLCKIKRTGKANGKKKEFNNEGSFYYSAFMLQLAKTMITIFNEMNQHHYLAIERLNGSIRQAKEDFEHQASVLTSAMNFAENVIASKGDASGAYQALYNQNKGKYNSCKSNARRSILQYKNEAALHGKEIEYSLELEKAFADELIAIYWQRAKAYFRKLDCVPPSFFDLRDLAGLYVPPIRIDETEISDTAEYERLEGIVSLPPPQRLSLLDPIRVAGAQDSINEEEDL